MSIYSQDKIRNVAIIAHVDHGKTTLVDGLLRQGNVFRANQDFAERVMDSNDIERERGITIVSKNTAVSYLDYKINIVDTPGHADFGGEVERVMAMVDGVLLLVDAVDGPMPQTPLCHRQSPSPWDTAPSSSSTKLTAPMARPDWVVDQTFDLFAELGATEEQLDFPVVYSSARQGIATLDLANPGTDLLPLFDTIVKHIHQPTGDPEAPFQMLISSLDFDEYRGRFGIGRIHAGRVKPNDSVAIINRDGDIRVGKTVGTFIFEA